MNDQQNTKKTPALNVFAKVTSVDGSSFIGSKIGVAWAHGNGGEGFNIILDAQPIVSSMTGQVELVAFPPKN